jgi:UDP-glucose 4-epimerase
LDNLDNSSLEALSRVRKITSCDPHDMLFAAVDLLDLGESDEFFQSYGPFDACIHFAGLKAVGESVELPLHYYANNVQGSVNLIHLLDKYNCRAVAFSSSATVYGDPEFVPLTESHPLRSTNPYGKTKLFIEEIFRDVAAAHRGKWSIALLRYFNPIGAHPSGLIGEDPKGRPNNLVPYVSQVAVGRLEKVNVFGNDYDTPDGTGVRDYIHVVDLAQGHVAAIQKVLGNVGMGAAAYNLGTGNGTSVLEVIAAMEKASGKKINYVIAPRRTGDIATCYADPATAEKELGWKAKLSVEQGIQSAWDWQSKNPTGFRRRDSIEREDQQGPAPRKCLVFQMYGQP